MKKTIIMTLCLLMAGMLFAEGTPGLDYAMIGGTSYQVSRGTATATHIEIPDTHEGLPVTRIANSGFRYYDTMLSVTIGNNVTEIGADAFRDCTSLESVIIGNSVNNLMGSAFRDCTSLTSVVFTNENGAADLVLGNDVFAGCTNLRTIDISGIINIPSRAFQNCRGLEFINIGNDVTNIGNYAFDGCSRLSSILIPNTVTVMSYGVFRSCDNLTIYAEATSEPSSWDENWNPSDRPVVWGFAPTSGLAYDLINNGTAYEVSEGTATDPHIIIPTMYNGLPVTQITGYGFRMHTLTSVYIPNSITRILSNSFPSCRNLTSIYIPDSVISLGSSVFSQCTSLTSVTIGSGLSSIGTNPFPRCPALETIVVSPANQRHHSEGNNLIETSTNDLVSGTKNSVIPSYVRSIGSYAFDGVTGLTSINIPSSVTRFYNYVFRDCTGLSYIIIPSNLTDMGNDIFQGCDNLTIYAEAESQPSGWNATWNSSDRPVFFDYINTALPPLALSADYKYNFIKLSWTEPLIAAHWTLNHYLIYRDGVQIGGNITELYYEDYEFVPSVEYEYHVIAVYSDPDIESVPSNSVTITWEAILPVTLSEFGAVSEDNGVKVHWTAESEMNMLGYRVWRAEGMYPPPTPSMNGGGNEGAMNGGGYISPLIPASNLSFTQNYHYLDTDVVNGKEYFYWLVAIELDGTNEIFGPLNITAVLIEDISITMTTMSSAYPNPMSVGSFASFDISVKADETAELSVYNIRGQLVRSYEGLDSGKQTVVWDGRDFNGREVSSGVYFYRLTSPSSHIVQRMVIVK